MNKFIGYLNIKETMEYEGEFNIKGLDTKGKKVNTRKMAYYKNKNVITCVIKKGSLKGVGIAKCNPKDKFDYHTGMVLAELRARENYYKNTSLTIIRNLRR